MNDSSSTPLTPLDQIKAEFFLELDRRGPEQADAIIQEFVQRYPDISNLEAELRADADLQPQLDAFRPEVPELVPDRLGEFEVRRRIDTGGMGRIYEANHPRLGRRVAVKTIRRGRGLPEVRERFRQEQRVLARLHQTNIIPIYAAGEEGDIQYYAMPYLDGANLGHVVRSIRTSPPTSVRTPTLVEWVSRLTGDAAHGATTASAAANGAPVVSDAIASPGGGAPTASPGAPIALSSEYFRSVAQVMADAAQAVHHVHEAGFIHRDLKPSNLMVERTGHSWVIDFGLAKSVTAASGNGHTAATDGPAADLTRFGIPGTPRYMAPEQWRGDALDPRTDVYSLGVTLYELLTLQPAFTGADADTLKQQILSIDPTPPRQLVAGIPTDLAAICARAMARDPARRYATAQELADDLRRWLRWEPVKARPARTPRRVWLWARRNPGWAVAILVGVLALIALIVGGFTVASLEASHAAEMTDLAAEKGILAAKMTDLAKKNQFEATVQQIQRIRLTAHDAHWSDEAWMLVEQAAKIRKDDQLGDQAAALLLGLDVTREKELLIPASAAAFDPTGKRLLLGGWTGLGAALWDESASAPIRSKQPGKGPVAFRGKTPLHLVADADNPARWLLWDVHKNQLLQVLTMPGQAPVKPRKELEMEFSPDGHYAAAAVERADSTSAICVWDTNAGKALKTFEVEATALAFSTQGQLLAAGQSDGTVLVWAMPSGKEVARLELDRNVITSLAFGPATVIHGHAENQEDWLLAVGDHGGSLMVWDLKEKMPRSFSHGADGEILALAFSPDGTVLASGNRWYLNLFDVPTGHKVLDARVSNYVTGLNFSPNGRRLAVSSYNPFVPVPGPTAGQYRVDVWRLDDGRGIQTLRGLRNAVMQVWFSPDDAWVAGLSYDWKLAFWDRRTGSLKHMIHVPPGVTADNAALAFHPDGKKFAFAAGERAGLWDLATGKRIGDPWKLNWGLLDQMVFHPKGKLLLFREERVPTPGAARKTSVCRLWELIPDNPSPKLVKAIDAFSHGVIEAEMSPNGKYVAIDGYLGPKREDHHVMVIDGQTGKELWRLSLPMTTATSWIVFDATEKSLAVSNVDDNTGHFLDTETGKTIRQLAHYPASLNTASGYWTFSSGGPPWGISLYRFSDRKRLVTLGIDVAGMPTRLPFNAAGTHLAWGNRDGTVFVADLPAIQKKLAAVGLGW